MRRRCLCGCGKLVEGSRCAESRAAQRLKYQGSWPAQSRDAITDYRTTHGDICPGWKRPAHMIEPAEWVTDHQAGPMCRACNTRKQNLGDG